MQLSYHAYYLVDPTTNEKFRVDIRPFVSGFVGWRNAAFKNEFTYAGESVFLLPMRGSVYIFVQARDKEIIKKIGRASMSVSEIRDALGDDESIGFASFICLGEDHLGIASTVLAPRINAFGSYINQVLDRLEVGLRLEVRPMTYTLPKNEVQKLSHVGAFSMKVQPGNRVWDSIVGSLGASDREDFDIGEIEITVRPRRWKGDNSRALAAALDAVGDVGLKSFDARAKMELADKMTDVFIVGAGGIRDPIDSSSEETIVDQILEATASNTVLEERLHDFRADAEISHVDSPAELDISWPPPRATALGSDEVVT